MIALPGDGRSRSRTGDLLRIREALCRLSYPPSVGRWARLDSNQQLLACETSALPLSYPPVLVGVLQIRDKGSNLDLHVQSVASCRLDDPGMIVCAYVTLGALSCNRAAERCFPCLSPTLRPWIVDRPLRVRRRSSSYVEELWSPMLS